MVCLSFLPSNFPGFMQINKNEREPQALCRARRQAGKLHPGRAQKERAMLFLLRPPREAAMGREVLWPVHVCP